jgi:hypothetical protein
MEKKVSSMENLRQAGRQEATWGIPTWMQINITIHTEKVELGIE